MPGFNDEGPSLEMMSGGDPYATVTRAEVAAIVESVNNGFRQVGETMAEVIGKMGEDTTSVVGGTFEDFAKILEEQRQVLLTALNQQLADAGRIRELQATVNTQTLVIRQILTVMRQNDMNI